MNTKYDPQTIEARWQARWAESRRDQVDLDGAARPFYNLMEFPYPSGEGLHVGHVFSFGGADTYGRFQRRRGYDVFQPIGFDAFGIHSENYALKVGAHPGALTPQAIARFREQLRRLGAAFDWSREVVTTDPAYYRWTQWIFVQLFKAGLAYRAEALVNWCPSCKTVLANEQVVEGRCERCDTPMSQRRTAQWFFRITRYADRLLDFSQVDFSPAVIKRQQAWIGRSEGAEIAFAVLSSEFSVLSFDASSTQNSTFKTQNSITVFTTRPDTIFGVTFVALAPEHPLAEEVARGAGATAEQVRAYVERSRGRLELERQQGEPDGVFTGLYSVNPASGAHVPIWVADYVLMGYGSGAVMGVPAHDERDFRFARRYGLPVIEVVADGRQPTTDNRQPTTDNRPTTNDQRPTTNDEPFTPSPAHPFTPSPLHPFIDDGVLIHSGPFDGLASVDARERISAWLAERGAGRNAVRYRLRDWLISRQRYWGPPIPIIYCDRCGTLPIPEEQLPVVLPPLEQFRPTGTGQSPLAAIADFVQTVCPRCGGPARRETDVSDNFLDSAWYHLRYTSTECDDVPWDRERVAGWLPVDMYTGGPEHATMHHLYARFIAMALHDLGLLPVAEPFAQLRLHGTITHGGRKMSKSRGNVINPDDYITRYGADATRMALLFLGPFEEDADFSDRGVAGMTRFLGRVWELCADDQRPTTNDQRVAPETVVRRLSFVVRRVTEDLEARRFHTAIAALMEYSNWLRSERTRLPPAEFAAARRTLVLLLAPFAPHIAEELWACMGGAGSVHDQPWPAPEPELAAAVVELPVQVDGRLRAQISVPADAGEEDVRAAAIACPRVREAIAGRSLRRVIVVPGRVINVVTSPAGEAER